jgi:putative FmdB family regulatory protein
VPLYEYECDACGRRFEVIHQKFSDAPVDVCKECGKGPVRRLLSSPAIQFKGSGFYITDYAKKGKTDATTSPAKTDTAKTETKESKETKETKETKTETKTESSASDSKSKE